MTRNAITGQHGARTLHGLEDFLYHAAEAEWALGERHKVQAKVADMMAESLAVRLGESLHRVSGEFIADHPEANLAAIIGVRNVVAHGYGIVAHEQLWASYARELPAVIQTVQALIT